MYVYTYKAYKCICVYSRIQRFGATISVIAKTFQTSSASSACVWGCRELLGEKMLLEKRVDAIREVGESRSLSLTISLMGEAEKWGASAACGGNTLHGYALAVVIQFYSFCSVL